MEFKKKLAVFIGILTSLYLVGLLAQILEFVNNVPRSPFDDKEITFNIGLNLSDILRELQSYPYNVISLGVVVVGAIYGYFNLGFNDDKVNRFRIAKENSYGSSGFMERRTVKEVYDVVKKPYQLKKETGTILGETKDGIILFPLESKLNRNIAVFGASGSMKSRAYVRNMIFQCVKRSESLVITDPKSELFNDFRIYLESKGYVVKTFNLTSPEHSDSWNCLSETEGDEILSQVFCDVIMKNTAKGKEESFWLDSMQNLLKALVLYIYQKKPKEQRNIGEVYNLLVTKDIKSLSALFGSLDNSNSAKQCYNVFDRSTEGVKSSVVTGLAGRLQVFQAKVIKEMTSVDDIDITLLGEKKCAYFLITSDQDTTFDFLGSLFVSFVFIKNVSYADKYGKDGKLEVPIHILADEIANIGEIPDLKKKISTVRSRGISLSVIFQSIAQMENRYNNNQWQEIIGNCDTQLFLGCTDEVTAKYISNRSGEVTAERKEKTFNMIRKEKRQSYNQRKLLTSDEVLRLDGLEALVITRGQKVLPVKKFDYTKHPESKYLKKSYVKDYMPKYKSKKINNTELESKGVAYEKKKEILHKPKSEDEKEINEKDLHKQMEQQENLINKIAEREIGKGGGDYDCDVEEIQAKELEEELKEVDIFEELL